MPSGWHVWEQLGRGPDNTRFNPDESVITPDTADALSEAWSSHVTSDLSEPILTGGSLYTTVATPGAGRVRAYDAETGTIRWDEQLPAPPIPGTPGPVVLVDGALWVSYPGSGSAACASQLTRLDPRTGSVLSTETTGPPILGPVVAAGKTVAYVTSAGCGQPARLVVRATNSPTASWTYTFPANVLPGVPSIGHDKVFVSAEDEVHGFTLTGCGAASCPPVWTNDLDLDDGTAVNALDTRPVVSPDGTVYIGANVQGSETLVEALDAATGARLWRTDLHPAPGLGWQYFAVAHDQLYVSDHRTDSPNGALEVFAAEGCGQDVCPPTWSAAIDGLPVGGPTVGGDVLHVGLFTAAGSRFVAFDARGCGAAVCPLLGDVDFGAEQPVEASIAQGRIAVVAAGSTGATLRVLAPDG